MSDHGLFPLQIPDGQAILNAYDRIKPYINRTPVLTCQTIDRMLGATIYFKCENFQKVGAFKARGATNAIRSLDTGMLKRGVCTHSSGNHAQALAWAASLAGVKAHIVMPSNSPGVKVRAVSDYGGLITFCEPNLQSREETLAKVQEQTGAIEIHPYNNYAIVAGQATAALELFEEQQGLDFVIAPVGGGGLLSGTALSARYFSPTTKVIAAEPLQANDAWKSFQQRSFVPSVNPDTIADGLRTSLGSRTLPVILEYVNEVVTTHEATIVNSMRLIWERMKILVEPSAAVPLAILMEQGIGVKGMRVGIILSGGNVDLDHLPWIASHE